MTARRAMCVGGACVALSGCSALGAATSTAPSRSTASVMQAQVTHEYPSAAPAQHVLGGGVQHAIEAIRAFATAYINWTPQTVAADMRALASQCVGQARSALQLAAAQTAGDYELRRGGISNSGSVEAIAPLPGGRHRYVVVTREITSATGTSAYQGLRPAWHVTIATVQPMPGGRWALSGWQPES